MPATTTFILGGGGVTVILVNGSAQESGAHACSIALASLVGTRSCGDSLQLFDVRYWKKGSGFAMFTRTTIITKLLTGAQSSMSISMHCSGLLVADNNDPSGNVPQ
jgi:hypothetical protein